MRVTCRADPPIMAILLFTPGKVVRVLNEGSIARLNWRKSGLDADVYAPTLTESRSALLVV